MADSGIHFVPAAQAVTRYFKGGVFVQIASISVDKYRIVYCIGVCRYRYDYQNFDDEWRDAEHAQPDNASKRSVSGLRAIHAVLSRIEEHMRLEDIAKIKPDLVANECKNLAQLLDEYDLLESHDGDRQSFVLRAFVTGDCSNNVVSELLAQAVRKPTDTRTTNLQALCDAIRARAQTDRSLVTAHLN